MSDPFLVGYDGSPASDRALDFAVAQAREASAPIVLVHVLEWSPYSFLTQEELAERHQRRKEELARAESAVVKPALERLAESGVDVTPVIRYGHSAEILVELAKAENARQIFVGRDGASSFKTRLFGSTAATLVQVSPVPCTIVP